MDRKIAFLVGRVGSLGKMSLSKIEVPNARSLKRRLLISVSNRGEASRGSEMVDADGVDMDKSL